MHLLCLNGSLACLSDRHEIKQEKPASKRVIQTIFCVYLETKNVYANCNKLKAIKNGVITKRKF